MGRHSEPLRGLARSGLYCMQRVQAGKVQVHVRCEVRAEVHECNSWNVLTFDCTTVVYRKGSGQ